MKVYELEIGKPVTVDTKFTKVDFQRFRSGDVMPEQISDKTRLLFAYDLLEMQVNNSGPIHVHANSAIKLKPGVSLDLKIAEGTDVYSISLDKSETDILAAFNSGYPDYRSTLRGRLGAEFDDYTSSRDQWFVGSKEINANHILSNEEIGYIIAPPFSRYNPSVGNGWNMMYMRGSPAFGLAVDALFSVRAAESEHFHKIMVEGYIVHDGEQVLRVDGEEVTIKPKHLVVFDNPETRCMVRFDKVPYRGATFQLPSLPGDKFEVH